MTYYTLGQSDLKVSAISYGCMSLPSDQAAASLLLHQACDSGINFFDTADLYQNGFNERMIGRALQNRRSEVIIASKVGNQWRPDGSGWDWNPSKEYILKSIHKSLERLRTDYLDLYQLHGGTIEDPIDEVIEAFEQLKKEGLIRAYGISSIRPNVIREYVNRSQLDSVMMQYSLLDRRPEESCFDLLKENQVSVIVRGGVAKGLLADKKARAYLQHSEEDVIRVQQALQSHSSTDRSSAQTALQYCLNAPAVTTVACGASRSEQIEENAGTMQTVGLTSAEIEDLQASAGQTFYEKHR